MTDEFEEYWQIAMDGFVDVDCSKDCGHSARIEPDADYACHSCKVGRLVSPLVLEGLI